MTSFQATSWTGGHKVQQASKLNVHPNAPFYLMHYPFEWEVQKIEGEYQWVPKFSSLYEIAGVNGVQDIPKQGPDSSYARMKFKDKGFTILDLDLGYVSRYETVYGGHYYALIWETPKQIADRVYWNIDEDAYNKWRLSLIGVHVQKPEIEVIQSKIDQIERRIDRKSKLQHIPEIKKEIESLYELKKNMNDAYTKMTTTPAKKGKQNA